METTLRNIFTLLNLCKEHNLCAYCGQKQTPHVYLTDYHCKKCGASFRAFKNYNTDLITIPQIYAKRWTKNKAILPTLTLNLIEIYNEPDSTRLHHILNHPSNLDSTLKEIANQQHTIKLQWQQLDKYWKETEQAKIQILHSINEKDETDDTP